MTATITTITPNYSSISATMNSSSGFANNTITTSVPNTYGPYITNSGTYTTNWANTNPATLKVQGDAVFEGNITVQGKNLLEVLNDIEQRLAILHPNKELEDKWEDLKKLGDMYRQLEEEILEKEKMWAILKK